MASNGSRNGESVEVIFDSVLGKLWRLLGPAIGAAMGGLLLWMLNQNTMITQKTQDAVAKLETASALAAEKALEAGKRADAAARRADDAVQEARVAVSVAREYQIKSDATLSEIVKLRLEHDSLEKRFTIIERKMKFDQ